MLTEKFAMYRFNPRFAQRFASRFPQRSLQRLALLVLVVSLGAFAQQTSGIEGDDGPVLKGRTEIPRQRLEDDSAPARAERARGEQAADRWVVPAGTRIPVSLRQAISTKNARAGDPIYGQTNFPIVVDENVMIPAGTYVQGVVDRVKRAGRIKGTAELEFHLTTLLYANGYTVNLAAAVDQVPGSDSTRMKEPGTIQHDPEKGKDLERIGRGAATGGAIGSVAGAATSGSVRGLGVGGVSGAAAGALIGVMARGSDVHFPQGTVVSVSLNQAIALNPNRVVRGRGRSEDAPPLRRQPVERRPE